MSEREIEREARARSERKREEAREIEKKGL
jgi:hypothetical protein